MTRNADAFRGFLLGTTVGAAIALTALHLKRRKRRPRPSRELPPEFRQEQLSRTALYFSSMSRLTSSRVLVIGAGGVGSHCAIALGRSGVRYLRVVDYDQVTLSSLNRHACATLADVGSSKVEVLKRTLEAVCPDERWLSVEARRIKFDESSAGELLEGEWDYVVDAIDDVPTKTLLLASCARMGLKVVSCAGAGSKADPTRVHVGDLRSCSRDPLCAKIRQKLKKLGGNELVDHPSITVVYSSEKTVVPLAALTEGQLEAGVENVGVMENVRVRVLPVLGTMPAIMGQACAAVVLCHLGEKPFRPVSGERLGRSVRHRLFQHFKNRETKLRSDREEKATPLNSRDDENVDNAKYVDGEWLGPVQIDGEDMDLLMEVWRNRCAVTDSRLGTVLELVRWDLSKPSLCNNLVLMGAKALSQFDLSGRDGIPKQKRMHIENVLRSIQ